MSEQEKISDTDRQQFWQRVMEARRESGLSVAAFCRQEGLSEGAYYCWRRKLAGRISQPDEKSPSAFLEVVMPGDHPVAVELVLSSGHTLRIHREADPNLVSQVLSAVKQVGLC